MHRTPAAPPAPALARGAAALALALALASGAGAQAIPDGALDHLRARNIGPANMSGRVVDLAVVESEPTVFYAATATGGVWKTTDGGVTLKPVFEHGGTHSVGDIAVSQTDTSIVWVGTGERASRQSNSWGDGVYRSTDGGKTWRNMGLGETKAIGRIAIHPTEPRTVFVAAMGHLWGPNEERGLYRTTDGGDTWRKVLYVDASTGVSDVAIDPAEPSVIYAASYQRRRRPFGFHGGGPGSALWKSTDGGETWKKLRKGLPGGEYGRIGISIYRKDPRIVYVSVEQGWRFNASTAYVRPDTSAGIFRSEDRGETWTHMGSWNPRPMYASQPLVDPNDDCRIYMENDFSVSTDCGRTFRSMDTSLHGDDRFLWVDPSDSRHMIHADDGGLGVTWNQGETWLFQTALPVSQWYHVRVDDDVPYNVYGGLQDNGCWVGPSATYRAEGILNEDWTRSCGGDGFLSVPDTVDGHTFYAESQYLGLVKLDRRTWDAQDIRPGDPHGAIGPRRNFDAWFANERQPELLNAMAPANWDGPYIISPHDHATLYAGTNRLWRSTDQGVTWKDLGDMTTGIDRRRLTIMGQQIGDEVPSLDDGIPYYPTITAIAESPLREGVLYVGTDDGNLKVSTDGGATWTELRGRLPGLPKDDSAWISMIEPSSHDAGTVYVVVNDYRNDDYANYLLRSTDSGRTWTSITGDLPAERVLRVVREDPRNQRVLWLGAELGLFVSIDGGARWRQLHAGMPTLAFNDLVIHPRDGDLVLASHGRGVWILDDASAIAELTSDVLAAAAHLFSPRVARTIHYTREKAHEGDMAFHGQNPPDGAILDYWLGEEQDSGSVSIEIRDASGDHVASVAATGDAGIDRVVWNLRYDDLPAAPAASGRSRGLPGPVVAPGVYTVRLSAAGRTVERALTVQPDPRLPLTAAQRAQWTADQRAAAALYRDVHAVVAPLWPLMRRASLSLRAEVVARGSDAALPTPPAPDSVGTLQPLPEREARRVRDVARVATELLSRARGLYSDIGNWAGPMTADQRSRMDFYRRQLEALEPRAKAVVSPANGGT